MKQIRYISGENVRLMCIAHNFYTCGDNEEYLRMLAYCDLLRGQGLATLNELYYIAADIKMHSSTELSQRQIVELLINECCATIKEENNE